jgi:hypothetical protein
MVNAKAKAKAKAHQGLVEASREEDRQSSAAQASMGKTPVAPASETSKGQASKDQASKAQASKGQASKGQASKEPPSETPASEILESALADQSSSLPDSWESRVIDEGEVTEPLAPKVEKVPSEAKEETRPQEVPDEGEFLSPPSRQRKKNANQKKAEDDGWYKFYTMFLALYTFIVENEGKLSETAAFRGKGAGTVECCAANIMMGLLKYIKKAPQNHSNPEGHEGFLMSIGHHLRFYKQDKAAREIFRKTIGLGEYKKYENVAPSFLDWLTETLPNDRKVYYDMRDFIHEKKGLPIRPTEKEIYDLFIKTLPPEEERVVAYSHSPQNFPNLQKPGLPNPSVRVPQKARAVASPQAAPEQTPALPTPNARVLVLPPQEARAVPSPQAAPEQTPALPTPNAGVQVLPPQKVSAGAPQWAAHPLHACEQGVAQAAPLPYITRHMRVKRAMRRYEADHELEKLEEFDGWVISAMECMGRPAALNRLKSEANSRWYDIHRPLDNHLKELLTAIAKGSEELANFFEGN